MNRSTQYANYLIQHPELDDDGDECEEEIESDWEESEWDSYADRDLRIDYFTE